MAVNGYLLGFELIELVIFALCLIHARGKGFDRVLHLLAGATYGLVLEIISVRLLNAYDYGHFTLMVLDVPLAVGIAWGNQIYVARLLSDATSLPEWARPVMDALLIIFVDLLIDPIAVRLGMWRWRISLQQGFFGIPYENFWGFFWLVTSFSIGLRLLAPRLDPISRWLAPLASLVLGAVAWVAASAVEVFLVPAAYRIPITVILLLAALGLLILLRPRLVQQPAALVWQLLLTSEGYFLLVGLGSGVAFRPPLLLVTILVVICTTVLAYNGARLWRPAGQHG